ncbi:ribosome-inactivating protein bryodin II-like [Momordica charantia]|uniref:rRNA N-glycosylase n=1 Tax=Momordica charantia TaxID=3673 RepID=A0A6J1DWK4_MOMCH|nr:ribosome-inactivating protein bryodin II-like [Momordica charantia]
MRFLPFYFVLALCFGALAAEADVSFSMLGATSETYRQFIRNLRSTLTIRSPVVYGIPVLQSTAVGSARFILVHLTNYNTESITVAIDVVNIYVVAYRAGNNAYFLNDASAEANNVLFKGIKHVRLPYKGNYDGLETAAGKISREKIDLGFSEISSSIGNMFHHNVGTSIARAFIVIIQSVLEAARFKYIEQRVSENVKTKFKPDPAFLSLENRWSDLSEQIQIAQKREGEFARAIELRTVSNKPIIVTNVSSPIVKGIALLLYYKVRVAIDNIIRMPTMTY